MLLGVRPPKPSKMKASSYILKVVKFDMKNGLWIAAQGGGRCGVAKPRKNGGFLRVALGEGPGF